MVVVEYNQSLYIYELPGNTSAKTVFSLILSVALGKGKGWCRRYLSLELSLADPDDIF